MSKRIREFDLDAPTLEKKERSEFRYQTRSLTNLFERCFGSTLKLDKAWKILIEVVPEISRDHYRDLLGVLTIQIRGNPKVLLTASDDFEKGGRALSWLVEGTGKLAAQLKIDHSPFLNAADRVRALGFQNARVWLGPVNSPNSNLSADVVIEHGVNEARLVGRILREDGTVDSEHFLVSEKPDEFMFVPLLGSLMWVDGHTVELKSKNADRAWRFQSAT